MEGGLASANWELTAAKARRARRAPDDSEITHADALIAARTLASVQVALGVQRFGIDWRLERGPPSARTRTDNARVAVRRLWFHALLRPEVGTPLFSIRKLARIANMNERTIRDDLARLREIVGAGHAYLADFIETVCEFVDASVPTITGAAQFFEHMEAANAKLRSNAIAARTARAKERAERRALPVPSPRACEVDAIMATVAERRREVLRRIDMAVINGDNANETERRMARRRLAAA